MPITIDEIILNYITEGGLEQAISSCIFGCACRFFRLNGFETDIMKPRSVHTPSKALSARPFPSSLIIDSTVIGTSGSCTKQAVLKYGQFTT